MPDEKLLPTEAELEKLPLRAVVVYALRNARRALEGLSPAVSEDPIVTRAMNAVYEVQACADLGTLDSSTLPWMGSQVVELSAKLSQRDAALVMSAFAAVMTAYGVLEASANPKRIKEQGAFAIRHAVRAARELRYLNEPAASTAVDSARHDYDAFLARFGARKHLEVGEPVNCEEF